MFAPMNDPIWLARVLKVLSVPARVRIAQLLKGRALCVNAISAQLDVTQGAVSQHLRIMRDAGLVTDEKRGCYVHYRLKEETLDTWKEAVGRLLDPTNGANEMKKGAKTCAAAIERRNNARSRRT